jgi:hypothetical protein
VTTLRPYVVVLDGFLSLWPSKLDVTEM